jgi:hypothetical protein
MAYGYEHEHHGHHNGMGTFGAMMIGLGVGVIGTVVMLAMNEKKFHYLVEEGKDVGKRLKGRLEEGAEVAKNAVADVAEGAENSSRKVKSSFRNDNA